MSQSIGDSRPPVPAEVRRRVLVEAGHRCAIPTCRHIEVDVHHIIPWAQCQTHEYDNLIALCPNCHRRADRGEIDRKSLRLYKFNLRFAHDKYSQLEMDILFEASRLTPGQALQWPAFNLILLKRIMDSGLIRVQSGPGTGAIFGMEISPLHVTLTDDGRRFLDDLGIREF
ncbi:MAG: HNH endonuclease [bacterium]